MPTSSTYHKVVQVSKEVLSLGESDYNYNILNMKNVE